MPETTQDGPVNTIAELVKSVFFQLRVWSRTTYQRPREFALCAQACVGLDAASVVEILQSDFFFVTIVFLKKTIVVKTLNLPMMGCYKPFLFIIVWILDPLGNVAILNVPVSIVY